VIITCSTRGCIMVTGKTFADAAKEWNARNFRDARHD